MSSSETAYLFRYSPMLTRLRAFGGLFFLSSESLTRILSAFVYVSVSVILTLPHLTSVVDLQNTEKGNNRLLILFLQISLLRGYFFSELPMRSNSCLGIMGVKHSIFFEVV